MSALLAALRKPNRNKYNHARQLSRNECAYRSAHHPLHTSRPSTSTLLHTRPSYCRFGTFVILRDILLPTVSKGQTNKYLHQRFAIHQRPRDFYKYRKLDSHTYLGEELHSNLSNSESDLQKALLGICIPQLVFQVNMNAIELNLCRRQFYHRIRYIVSQSKLSVAHICNELACTPMKPLTIGHQLSETQEAKQLATYLRWLKRSL